MKRGSITPFLALSLMLIASLILVLLESARVQVLDRYAALKAEAGADSVCAEFQPFLWLRYGVLMLDGAYGAEHFSMNFVGEVLEEQIKKGMQTEAGLNLLSFDTIRPALEGYALATDAEGEVFLNLIAECQKEKLPMAVAETLYEGYKTRKGMEERYKDAKESIERAREVTWEVIAKEQEVEEGEEPIDTTVFSDAWSHIRSVQDSAVIRLVLGENPKASREVNFVRSPIERRLKDQGNMRLISEKEWYRKLVVLHYMGETFSNYLVQKAEHYLAYEMEYVLCGKETEWQNLETALDKLIWMRVAYNMVSLIQDEEKMNLINRLAYVLGLLAQENPAVVQVFKTGFTAAWAYLESVLDVRALVAGEKISLIKTKEEWTSGAGHLLYMISSDTKAKSCESGLSYVDYLKQLLFFTEDRDMAYRMMEVMEFSLQRKPEYRNCKMQHMIVAMQYQIEFVTEPIFSSLVSIGQGYERRFYFKEKVRRSYIP